MLTLNIIRIRSSFSMLQQWSVQRSPHSWSLGVPSIPPHPTSPETSTALSYPYSLILTSKLWHYRTFTSRQPTGEDPAAGLWAKSPVPDASLRATWDPGTQTSSKATATQLHPVNTPTIPQSNHIWVNSRLPEACTQPAKHPIPLFRQQSKTLPAVNGLTAKHHSPSPSFPSTSRFPGCVSPCSSSL